MSINKYNLLRLIIRFKSGFIWNKEKRKIFRETEFQKLDNYIKEDIKKRYKFGISYSIFDGEELLEPSLICMRNVVDYINVIYQTESWTKEYTNNNILNVLLKLKEKKLIDEIIEYKPDIKLTTGRNEAKKRNLGLHYAKKAHCKYFMTMDVDEFYIPEEIEKKKQEIVENNITHSYCPIINYGLLPTKRRKRIGFYAVQFFCKINIFSKLGKKSRKITVVDVTRRMSDTLGSKHVFFCDVQMHHMSYVRNNIELKLKSSSSEIVNKIPLKSIENINSECTDIEDIFNIMPYLKGQNYE